MFNVLHVLRSIFNCGKTWFLNPCDPTRGKYRLSANPGDASVVTCSVNAKMRRIMSEAINANGVHCVSCSGEVEDCSVFGEGKSHSLMVMVVQPRASEPWLMGVQDTSCDREWSQDERRLFTEVGLRMAEALSAFLFLRDLRKSEKRFKDLVGNIPGVVFRCTSDLDWSMLYISDYVEKITGYSSSDFIDNSVRTYNSVIAEEDRDAVREIVRDSIKKRRTVWYRVPYF